MTLRQHAPLYLALLAAAAAQPALAQSSDDWTGGYIGGFVGQVMDPDDGSDRFLFDTDLDGRFGDTVRTGAGADAFSPGSCNGVARGATPAAGCEGNSGGADWGIRGGYDWQFGNWVVGVVGEYVGRLMGAAYRKPVYLVESRARHASASAHDPA